MWRNRAYLIGGVAALALALPGAANAAQVSTGGTLAVFFNAAPGETNRVTVQATGDAVLIRDDGAPVTAAGGDCTQVDAHQVRCPPTRALFTALLEDGDDTITVDGPFSTDLRAGAGNDTITGGSARDNVDGGDGNDTISTGEGDDTIRGGAGSDTISGGPGIDTATYDSPTPITATLDGLRNDGAAGENDLIGPDVEGVTGGLGNDTITGNDGPNILNGSAGRDRVLGLGGNDELTDGSGGNTLDGGDGDDTIDSRGIFESDESGFVGIVPNRDSVTCGAGADTVTGDILDRAAADCERIDTGISLPGRTLTARRDGTVPARVHCGALTTCRFSMRLRHQSNVITTTPRGRVPAGATRTVRMRLSKTGRSRLLARHRLRVDVIVYGRAMPGALQTDTLTVGTLRRR